MAQTLLVGLGGTGSRIVNNVAKELQLQGRSINSHGDTVWCTVFDTDRADTGRIEASGINVPVIPTSKDQIIEEYIATYPEAAEWMPLSPEVLQQSMKAGASQMRAKSRLAFYDVMKDGTIADEFAEVANGVMMGYDGNSNLTIMIVSSLSGGTGSGIFIQVALWLRQYFENLHCKPMIRGMFLMPDIFINTIENIHNKPVMHKALYANAYASFRELTALQRIKTEDYTPAAPIALDSLFDSVRDKNQGKKVFDYAFLVDDKALDGTKLSSMSDYEQVISRMIYMQLFMPLSDSQNSEEDNYFKIFDQVDEPLYASSGTSKAVYPYKDVLQYCALKASRDSISNGWKRIDDEIVALQKRENEREKAGNIITDPINPREKYVQLFENKIAKTGDQVGKDTLFKDIANDIVMPPLGNTEIPEPKSKVFCQLLETETQYVLENDLYQKGIDLSAVKLTQNWKKSGEKSAIDKKEKATPEIIENVRTVVEQKAKAVNMYVDQIEAFTKQIAEAMIETVFPIDMGDINENNEKSIYGLLTKVNKDGERYFIHPIAARYVLLKLKDDIEYFKDKNLSKLRAAAIDGYEAGDRGKFSFDYNKTKKVSENTPLEYITAFKNNPPTFGATDALVDFKDLYARYNDSQLALCTSYGVFSIMKELAILITKRLDSLIKTYEAFFSRLDDADATLKKEIEKNIAKNEAIEQKTVFICASEDEKESIYQSLDYNANKSNNEINALVAKSLYSKFCVTEADWAENNKQYAGFDAISTFLMDIVKSYRNSIVKERTDIIDMDIYTAICRSSDFKYIKKHGKLEDKFTSLESINLEEEETSKTVTPPSYKRYAAAFAEVRDTLKKYASPFLNYGREIGTVEMVVGNKKANITTTAPTAKTQISSILWGFHPAVAQSCDNLGDMLDVQIDKLANDVYPKNEFYCYRATYGIKASDIPKFSESSENPGLFFTNYTSLIKDMSQKIVEGDVNQIVQTPHLDKNWHRILPPISLDRQEAEDVTFYKRFWYALAYKQIYVNKGVFMINRLIKSAFGTDEEPEKITYNGNDVRVSEIHKLVSFLQTDETFVQDGEHYEEKFRAELAAFENDYVNTELFKALASPTDINAATIITRYCNNSKMNYDATVARSLKKSVELIFAELVACNYGKSKEDQAKIANVTKGLLGKIYTKAKLDSDHIDMLNSWKPATSSASGSSVTATATATVATDASTPEEPVSE